MAYPTAAQVIAKAKSYVRSAPYGSPNTFSRWYGFGGQAVAWCAIWVYYVLAATGGKELMAGCRNKAYCPTIWNWADAKGYTLTRKSTAREGDLVLFDWNKDNVCDHIGFVIKDLGNGYVQTVEGNTSNASNGNGGCCQIRTRSKTLIRGFVRLPYATTKSTPKTYQNSWWIPVVSKSNGTKENIRKWQAFLCWAGYPVAKDGSFGPDTIKKTKAFQKRVGITQDGSVGVTTTKKAKAFKK